MSQDDRKELVFDAASDVFAAYGFRRTSMNDIAQAAGISRPALYLLFNNKEDLFRQMATARQNFAIDQATNELASDASLPERVAAAIQTYEAVYYEPVSESPHGAELMDVNLSIAADDMQKGHERLIAALAKSIDDAVARGEVEQPDLGMNSRQYIELLMSSIFGQKKSATSKRDFRRKVRSVISVFMMPFDQKTSTTRQIRRAS